MIKILLTKEVPINWSDDNLNNIISNLDSESFGIQVLQSGGYKFLSNFSLGTAIVKGSAGMIEGIRIFGEIEKASESTSIIRFTTKIRIELIFICAFWVGMILFQIFGDEKIPLWINLILFPAMIVWLWFVYRIQEKSLMNKVEKKLKTPYNHQQSKVNPKFIMII